MTRPSLPTVLSALVLLASAGCQHTPQHRGAAAPPPKATTAATPPGSAPVATYSSATSELLTFAGACDASGAVPLPDSRFAVGDDEDNILRIYDGRAGGAPLSAHDISPALALQPGKKRPPEADIEAATELDGLSYWLTSHGLTSSAKKSDARFRFFATRVAADGTIEPVGQAYTRLLDDLLAEPSLAHLPLAAAAQRAPKEPGGLNIEGMTGAPDGRRVVMGFRNPLFDGKALIVTLANPRELLDGKPARFERVQLVDLGGNGVRSISWWRGRYLLIGGSPTSGGTSRLYAWDGESSTPTPIAEADFTGLNPEAFVTAEDSDHILVLSDDGTALIDGVECKRLKDATKKRFRGLRVRLASEVP